MNYKREIARDTPQKTAEKREERGMAIILTLGVLSMLLVIALAFASNARTDRKAAAANASLTQAKLLAESAVERVLGINQYYSATYPASEDVVATTSTHGTNNSVIYTDFLSHLDTTVNNENIYTYDPVSDAISWVFVYADPDPANSGDEKIIGRIAYTVISASNKINPAVAVQHEDASGYPDADGVQSLISK